MITCCGIPQILTTINMKGLKQKSKSFNTELFSLFYLSNPVTNFNDDGQSRRMIKIKEEG